MSDIAWTTKRLFPFIAGTNEQLDGRTPETGQLGFGTLPKWACPIGFPGTTTRNTGWQPIIKGLGYVTLNQERLHDIRIQFSEQLITAGRGKGSTVLTPDQRWSQVIFDETRVRFIYLVNIPVPVSEESGNPFNLQIITSRRRDPSTIVVDWAWARFVLDISASTQSKLGAGLVDRVINAGRQLLKVGRDGG